MRAVFDALERLGIRYFVTGSVAASAHGVSRQSHDTDVVLIDAGRSTELAEAGRDRAMRPDPGLALQEAVIAGMTAEARGQVRLRHVAGLPATAATRGPMTSGRAIVRSRRGGPAAGQAEERMCA